MYAALLGLLANAALGHLWYHPRPFVTHPRQTELLVGHTADNSFPSDHTTVAFAIAVAVLVFHRRLGAVFVVLAALIGVDRIFVGVHYPVDVLAGALVGTAAALVVAFVGRPYVAFTVRLASRITDPLVGAARARVDRTRRRRGETG